MKAETSAARLQAHMANTYVNLRLGIGAIGACLPFLLWLGGMFGDGESLRSSMSDYYYSPTVGDWFVGALVAIGVFLLLYKGFSTYENWALNLAGAFAVGVAFVPTAAPGDTSGGFTWHGTFAVLFFLSIAYVCVVRASDTLSLIKNEGLQARYKWIYRAFGIAMLLSPLIAVVLSFTLQPTALTFFVEALAVLTFAAYWIVKTYELRSTDAERHALSAELQAPTAKGMPVLSSGGLVQAKA